MSNKILPTLLHGADYNYEQWLDYPDILDRDFELMKKAKCNVMSVGIFSWAKLEPTECNYDFTWMDELIDRLHINDIKVILSTQSGSKPVWLSQNYPEVCRVDVKGHREPHGFRHNHCRTSPIYREKVIKLNTLLAERYKNHPAILMWHVSNEYNSIECYCDHCISAFHTWLQKKYGSIDNLNKAWWTTFWSHIYTEWSQIYPSDPSVHGMMLDWQRYTSDQTLDFFITESKPLREITPDIPITTNFMVPNVGLDYWSFAPHMDMVSWDSYPEWHKHGDDWKEGVKVGFVHDLYRSIKDQSFMMMESSPNVTNWQGTSIPKRENMHLLSSLQAIAHGSDTVQYFQWRQSRGGEEKFHGAVLSHGGRDNTRVFKGVTDVGQTLENISEVCGTSTNAEVAIIYDFQNEWAIDNAQIANNLDKKYKERCIKHYESFWSMGIPVDIKGGGCNDLSKYKVVIAPMLYMLRDEFTKDIKAFVENGGTFITTYLSGVVDETDLCFLNGAPGNLTELLGLWSEDLETLNDYNIQNFTYNNISYKCEDYAERVHLTDSESESFFTGGVLNGSPCIATKSFGKGKVYYLAMRGEDKFYRDFYKNIVEETRVKRLFDNIPQGVTIQQREGDKYRYLFFMNFTDRVIELDCSDLTLQDLSSGNIFNKKVNLDSYGIKICKQVI